jgi:hypothetical protein
MSAAARRQTRMRRALLAVGSCALAVSASACATTEQESAKIGRESQLAAASLNAPAATKDSRRRHAPAHPTARRRPNASHAQ